MFQWESKMESGCMSAANCDFMLLCRLIQAVRPNMLTSKLFIWGHSGFVSWDFITLTPQCASNEHSGTICWPSPQEHWRTVRWIWQSEMVNPDPVFVWWVKGLPTSHNLPNLLLYSVSCMRLCRLDTINPLRIHDNELCGQSVFKLSALGVYQKCWIGSPEYSSGDKWTVRWSDRHFIKWSTLDSWETQAY